MIFSLTIFNLQASEITDPEAKELQRRVELYGLDTPRDLIPLDDKKEYDNGIILKLQTDIKDVFIPALQSKFGNCDKEDCQLESNKYQILQTSDRAICLPYTQCGFYKCMEKQYECKPQGVDYFTDLAFPTCSTYTKNISRKWFTQKGYEWIYTTMVCLQKGLIEECELNGNCQKETAKKTCNYITDFTLKFHPSCYLNSGVGVCKLPLKDKINVWRTVGKYLTARERQEAFKVVLGCIKSGN